MLDSNFYSELFPPIPENQFNFSYVIQKESGQRCLRSQCSELECDRNGTSPPLEVHFKLNLFLFLALQLFLSLSLSRPLPPIPVFLFSLFVSASNFLCVQLSLTNFTLYVFFSLLHLSSCQMVNHMVQFCSISRVLSYDDSPIIIKSE